MKDTVRKIVDAEPVLQSINLQNFYCKYFLQILPF